MQLDARFLDVHDVDVTLGSAGAPHVIRCGYHAPKIAENLTPCLASFGFDFHSNRIGCSNLKISQIRLRFCPTACRLLLQASGGVCIEAY